MTVTPEFTGIYDDAGQPIFVGDILTCIHGWDVIVEKVEDKFICRKIFIPELLTQLPNHTLNETYPLVFTPDHYKST